MSLSGLRCLVVGGSIGGLAAAVALLRHGADVQLFERSPGAPDGQGAGMGVEPGLIGEVLAAPRPALACAHLTRRHVFSAWEDVMEPASLFVTHYELLRQCLRERLPDERYHPASTLAAVEQHDGEVRAVLEDGRVAAGEVLICADGYHARSRGMLFPEGVELHASYAGYVLWRGVLNEADLGAELREYFFRDALHIIPRPPYHMVVYPVPGPGGDLRPGHRRLNWGWYFGASEARLREELLVDRHGVQQPRAVPPGQCAPRVLEDLRAVSKQTWPKPCHALLETTIAAEALSLRPIYEYLPSALVSGRAGLLGDAAHVASPITGSGARFAMLDALELVRTLEQHASQGGADVRAALRAYEQRRLGPARQLVASGHAMGASFRS
ncbi:MAG: FAD-dependent monooxygenase [Hyalangium sp.]|uniref:FAD binding domain-containing protein n=1 Tax=Hyalangium sp. TaxID=2028555 RepID=UPI00389B1702